MSMQSYRFVLKKGYCSGYFFQHVVKATFLGVVFVLSQVMSGLYADPLCVSCQQDGTLHESYTRRGVKEFFSGKELETIGMPCGGIGTGQMYLCGDGTLGNWEIFNKYAFLGYGEKNYEKRIPTKPVKQGFVLVCQQNGKTSTRPIDSSGFRDVTFQGEYPVGTITYRDDSSPVQVTLQAFSPFIPLNAKDSALPVVVMRYTVSNKSREGVRVDLLGYLENAVCRGTLNEYGSSYFGRKEARYRSNNSTSRMTFSVYELFPEVQKPLRETIVFADFEGNEYPNWTIEGDAFGKGPSRGTQPNQQVVTGFLGEGLVNSFPATDSATGILTSPPFTVSRNYITFLIGGGDHPDKTCINLLIDGRVVRTATGRNQEKLMPKTWSVAEFEGKQAQIQIVDRETGGWGHINVDHICFSDQPVEPCPIRLIEAEDYGTLTLASLNKNVSPVRITNLTSPITYTKCDEEILTVPLGQEQICGLLTEQVLIAPGREREFIFLLAWHFPNTEHGHEYETRFADADAVVDYVARDFQRLAGDTLLWRDTYYDSTLPYWLLDRLHAPVATLATGTCQWWKNGRFYAYEGVVCCHGTCTHVWNYAHSHARLFPELARSIREHQDFCPASAGGGFHEETGLVGFRSDNMLATDGQCATILNAYREHLTSSDDRFLRKYWVRIRKAMEFLLKEDGNDDGLIEGEQPNTYDCSFFGPNTFVGSLYLSALRACEEMAREMEDMSFADRLHSVFEKGRAQTIARLWNGEYFIQEVDLNAHPQHQYAQGCLSDQLLGQNWAHQLALGYIYPKQYVLGALEAIWKYNWASDVGPHMATHAPWRRFAEPGEAGLFVCTWPNGDYLPQGIPYRDEVWTGIEYQVAAEMIYEGMLKEGLAICRAVHERYHPNKRNPYNEVECSDHYARAMASWGVYLALSGFEYHGPKGYIAFSPRLLTDDGYYRTAFIAAEGWGTFDLKRSDLNQSCKLTLKWGKLRLSSFGVSIPECWKEVKVNLRVNGSPVRIRYVQEGTRLKVSFDELILDAGDELVWHITTR